MAVLLLLVALIAPGITQNTFYSSCPPPPPPPCPPSPSNPCNYNNDDLFATSYINVVAKSANTIDYDNICHTFYPIKDKYCSYLAYLTGVYTNGSSKTTSYIVSSNSTNVFYYYSPICSFKETLLTNCNQVEIIVRDKIEGDCPDIVYPVLVSYPCLGYGSSNDLAQIQQVLQNNGINGIDLFVLPRNLPTQCVTTQSSTSTGSTINCPAPCYGSPSSYDDTVSVPSYPNYVYSPSNPPNTNYPSPCGCGSSK